MQIQYSSVFCTYSKTHQRHKVLEHLATSAQNTILLLQSSWLLFVACGQGYLSWCQGKRTVEGAPDQSSAAPQLDCREQCPFPPASHSSLEASLKEVQELELNISHSCPPSQLCLPSQFVSQINSPAVSFSCADLFSSSLPFDGSFSPLGLCMPRLVQTKPITTTARVVTCC